MDRTRLPLSGWGLVAVAAATMGAVGLYQFAWSSFRTPLGARVGAGEAALGTVFTMFVAAQTRGQFPAGWVRDRRGPRLPLVVAAALLAAGFAGFGAARTVPAAAAAAAVGGLGVSAAYTVAVNTPVKWFTERRGLATGVVTMAYAAVAVPLIPAVRRGATTAFRPTMLALAGLVGGAALVAAVVLRDPETDGEAGPVGADQPEGNDRDAAPDGGATGRGAGGRSWTTREVVRTRTFWLLYGVFALVNGVGLMVISKVVSFAAALSLPAAVVTASASVVALADAAGVVAGGSVADRVGYRPTLVGTLVLCGAALAGATLAADAGLAGGFVVLVGAAAFFRSPPFAVLPAVLASFYGTEHSSANYGALYTAKLFGGVFGGAVAGALVASVGWTRSFLLGAALVALAGVAMLFVRPVER